MDNSQVEYVDDDLKANVINKNSIHTQPAIYQEAIDRYPTDESIDEAAERKLIRKIDRRILPLLGICYFFYVSWLKSYQHNINIYKVRRQNHTFLCRHLRYQRRSQVKSRRILLAFQ